MKIYHRPVFLIVLFSLMWPFGRVTGNILPIPGFKSPIGYGLTYAADHEVSAREKDFGWVFQPGDWLKINVATNTLYLVREDVSEMSVGYDIGSGLDQDENVFWLGMSYNPRTPVDEWKILSKNQQNIWWVFGSKEASEQLFLRMYRKNDVGEYEYSRYGIHTTPNVDSILTNGGYGSWGCVLATYDFLKFLEGMFDYQNSYGQGVRVVTYR